MFFFFAGGGGTVGQMLFKKVPGRNVISKQ